MATPTKEEMEALAAQRHRDAQRAAGVPRMGVVPVAPVSGKAGEILQHLHKDEPVFIFRAQDLLSIFALEEYARVIEKYTPHGPQLESIVEAKNQFRAWQIANPSKVKLPDL